MGAAGSRTSCTHCLQAGSAATAHCCCCCRCAAKPWQPLQASCWRAWWNSQWSTVSCHHESAGDASALQTDVLQHCWRQRRQQHHCSELGRQQHHCSQLLLVVPLVVLLVVLLVMLLVVLPALLVVLLQGRQQQQDRPLLHLQRCLMRGQACWAGETPRGHAVAAGCLACLQGVQVHVGSVCWSQLESGCCGAGC